MSSQDPWERREAERQRFAKRRESPDLFGLIRENAHALILLGIFVLLFMAEIPYVGSGLRTAALIAGTVSILVAIAINRDASRSTRAIVLQGIGPMALALAVWSGVCLMRSDYRAQASIDMLRVLAGVGVYFYTVSVLRGAREVGTAVGCLLALASAAALYDFALLGQRGGINRDTWFSSDNSAFGTHESVGSFLALLLPMVFALAFSSSVEEKRRLAAQGVTLILTFAWIMARCRSAWFGGGVAVLAMWLMMRRFPITVQPGRRGKNEWITSPITLIVTALIVLAIVGGMAPALSRRLASLGGFSEDGSLAIRLEMWRGAVRMLAERPWGGWGLAGYMVDQGDWTHLGDTRWQVLTYGARHSNIAHNYFVQWAADTGIVGLALFIGVLGTFFLGALRALPQARSGIERTLLIGCIAAVAGGIIASLGAPAWNFPGVWAGLWFVMGAAQVMARDGARSATTEPSWGLRLAPLGVGVLIGLGLLAAGIRANDPKGEARGYLEVSVERAGPYRPGESVSWRARFRDIKRHQWNTSPGAHWIRPVWIIPAQKGQAERRQPIETRITLQRFVVRMDLIESGIEMALPTPPTPDATLILEATYDDRYGRPYTAGSSITVEAR